MAAPPSSADATKAGSASPPNDVEFLRANSDFRRVFKLGVRRRFGGLVVIEAPAESGTGRVGIVATRKVGNAVARNRAKRRLRAAVRQVGPSRNKDYIMIASRSVVTAPFPALQRWVEQGLNKDGDMEESGK